MVKHLKLILMGALTIFRNLYGMITERFLFKLRMHGESSLRTLHHLDSQKKVNNITTEEEDTMVKKSKKQIESEETTQQGDEQQMIKSTDTTIFNQPHQTNNYIESNMTYDTFAYSMFEGNGKYHVIRIPFNSVSLHNGNVEIVESNTEKLIIQERLQVLLFGADIL